MYRVDGAPETLEDFLDNGCEKLRQLQAATMLIKAKDSVKQDLLRLRTAVSDVQSDLEKTRNVLSKLREQNEQCRILTDLLGALDRKIVHMELNIPEALLSEPEQPEGPKESKEPKEPSPVRCPVTKPVPGLKKPVKVERTCPVIAAITKEEFAKVPRYIVGKQSLDSINSFVDSLNKVLKIKYSLLTMGKVQARKQGDLDMFIYYEKQELDMESRGEFVQFFTNADYERETNSKLSKTKLNQLIVLRQCKRIREYRVKNELRYIVVPTE